MDVLHGFLEKQKTAHDILIRSGDTILEFTRPAGGLYLRITMQGENRFNLYLVQNGGSSPKQKWHCGEFDTWPNLTRGKIRERCEKALRS
ncbi:MAG: hypothetical protein WDZ93_04220 [Candidatus Paceibacterota bacterium]